MRAVLLWTRKARRAVGLAGVMLGGDCSRPYPPHPRAPIRRRQWRRPPGWKGGGDGDSSCGGAGHCKSSPPLPEKAPMTRRRRWLPSSVWSALSLKSNLVFFSPWSGSPMISSFLEIDAYKLDCKSSSWSVYLDACTLMLSKLWDWQKFN